MMAHPYHHALSSVRKWGGQVDDYIRIHASGSTNRRKSLRTSGIARYAITPRAFSWRKPFLGQQ